MSRASCSVHGNRPGPPCCIHVHRATHGMLEVLANSTIEFDVDCLDDGHGVIRCIVCASCAQQFRLVAGATRSWEYMEITCSDLQLVPTCPRCIELWRTSTNPKGADA